MKYTHIISILISVLTVSYSSVISAQAGPPTIPQFASPEVAGDGRVKFGIYAPKAEEVSLSSPGDIPDINPGSGVKMQKNSEGVWSITVDQVPAGTYRYNFNVDGVSVMDPRNPVTSESNMNSWSMVHVPGADFMDTRDVPHGAVSIVTYYSSSLNRFRRMHVYTPAGYENNSKRYPVFYLLHGAMDSDDSWSTVGRAGFILDNLIADEKAVPMIVVMPAGHTGPFQMGGPRLPIDEFVMDFNNDILPYVEQHYRVNRGRKYRAIAGLSMGGAHTLSIAIPNLDKFAYIGVYSSGVFGITGEGPGASAEGQSYEEQNMNNLEDKRLKKGLKLFWFSTGKDDFLIDTTRATVAMFRKHGFEVNYEESEGGHTWINWRNYLNEFTRLLFK